MIMACAIAYFSMPYVIKAAHYLGAVDQPDQRKVHKQIMPRTALRYAIEKMPQEYRSEAMGK